VGQLAAHLGVAEEAGTGGRSSRARAVIALEMKLRGHRPIRRGAVDLVRCGDHALDDGRCPGGGTAFAIDQDRAAVCAVRSAGLGAGSQPAPQARSAPRPGSSSPAALEAADRRGRGDREGGDERIDRRVTMRTG